MMKNAARVRGGVIRARWRPAAALGLAVVAICIALKAAGAAAADTAAGPRSPADLSRLTIEELANIDVSSVSKKAEPLSDAAAAIYVITRQDIRRYGATSIPEILRLAPNLQVARVDSNRYAITARGFNSTSANKLLVLIDGRSVYTPLFSGVFWDVQDVFIEDIERIEVISGPGGTLWGSNAVNGVINIITRHTRDTTGGLVSIDAGTEELGAGVRYGGKIGEEATYRLYAKGFDRDDTVTGSGTSVADAWKKGQLGFRVDWGRASDALTLQGDLYGGTIDQLVNDDKQISGGNMLGRWNRTLRDGSAIQLQAYFDRTRRVFPGTFGEVLQTYDIDAQHRFQLGARHEIVWGGGYRWSQDDVTNSAALAFLPASRSLSLGNIFLQDSVSLIERLKLTVGVKLEHNTYTGLEVQPSARLAWKLRENVLVWSAVSRAVRTPSRLDRDFFLPGGAPFQIAGGPDFRPEAVTAYEIGYRMEPVPQVSFSISTFYHVYDDLRSIEAGTGGAPPGVFENKMEGETYGVEVWGSYRVLDWWRLSVGFNYLQEDLRFKPGSRDTFGVQAAGNDPTYQLSLRSTMNPMENLELDLALRSIDSLPNPDVPGYVALDGRIGWKVSKVVELALSGFNLLDRRHPEFGAAPGRSELARTGYLQMRWSF